MQINANHVSSSKIKLVSHSFSHDRKTRTQRQLRKSYNRGEFLHMQSILRRRVELEVLFAESAFSRKGLEDLGLQNF